MEKSQKRFKHKGLQMESRFVIPLGRGFSIALATGLPLPPARRGSWLTVDSLC